MWLYFYHRKFTQLRGVHAISLNQFLAQNGCTNTRSVSNHMDLLCKMLDQSDISNIYFTSNINFCQSLPRKPSNWPVICCNEYPWNFGNFYGSLLELVEIIMCLDGVAQMLRQPLYFIWCEIKNLQWKWQNMLVHFSQAWWENPWPTMTCKYFLQ